MRKFYWTFNLNTEVNKTQILQTYLDFIFLLVSQECDFPSEQSSSFVYVAKCAWIYLDILPGEMEMSEQTRKCMNTRVNLKSLSKGESVVKSASFPHLLLLIAVDYGVRVTMATEQEVKRVTYAESMFFTKPNPFLFKAESEKWIACFLGAVGIKRSACVDCTPPGSSAHRTFQNTGMGCHFLAQGSNPCLLMSPALADGLLPLAPAGKPRGQ